MINVLPEGYHIRRNVCQGYNILKERGEAAAYLKINGRTALFLERARAEEYARLHAASGLLAHEEVPNWKG